jgi:hypothetical protein
MEDSAGHSDQPRYPLGIVRPEISDLHASGRIDADHPIAAAGAALAAQFQRLARLAVCYFGAALGGASGAQVGTQNHESPVSLPSIHADQFFLPSASFHQSVFARWCRKSPAVLGLPLPASFRAARFPWKYAATARSPAFSSSSSSCSMART